jgi:hypothetical protein
MQRFFNINIRSKVEFYPEKGATTSFLSRILGWG